MTTDSAMHIGLISRYYPPDPGGGLALYTRQIAEELVRQGHRVTVFASSTTGEDWHTQEEGVLVRRVPQHKVYQRSWTGATCLWNSWLLAKDIERVHRQDPVDVIQCPVTFFESLAWGRFYKTKLGVPLIAKFHENRETYERIEGALPQLKAKRRQLFKHYLRQVALDADYWLGVSHHALTGMVDYLGLGSDDHPRQVSESPIDVIRLSPTEAPEGYFQRYGLMPETPFIFYSGRLIYEKGLHLLVEAFLADISAAMPEVHLAIAGEFDYRQPAYEHQIRERLQGHPAAERVHFLGRIAYDQMSYWYSQCKLFVAPSFCEPFGRVFIEAMACEAPVVGFAQGGPLEIIRHGEDGFLVTEQTASSLGQAMRLLLDSPELLTRLGIHARQTVVSRYSQEEIVADLVNLYAGLAQQKAGPKACFAKLQSDVLDSRQL